MGALPAFVVIFVSLGAGAMAEKGVALLSPSYFPHEQDSPAFKAEKAADSKAVGEKRPGQAVSGAHLQHLFSLGGSLGDA